MYYRLTVSPDKRKNSNYIFVLYCIYYIYTIYQQQECLHKNNTRIKVILKSVSSGLILLPT